VVVTSGGISQLAQKSASATVRRICPVRVAALSLQWSRVAVSVLTPSLSVQV
jgi:hypothetical protein